MRQAKVFFNKTIFAGVLTEKDEKQGYLLEYAPDYNGPPISLNLPISQKKYEFGEFPAFFEGILPEGLQLEALLRLAKLDRKDYFGQLLRVGKDLVGAFSVEEFK